MKLQKTYKRGGGGYMTEIAGVRINIDRQYDAKTWIAQSAEPLPGFGWIDIERETLASIRDTLERIDGEL